jgi:hypothetical protein
MGTNRRTEACNVPEASGYRKLFRCAGNLLLWLAREMNTLLKLPKARTGAPVHDPCPRSGRGPRATQTWRYGAAQLAEAAGGGDVEGAAVSLRLVLMLEGVECQRCAWRHSLSISFLEPTGKPAPLDRHLFTGPIYPTATRMEPGPAVAVPSLVAAHQHNISSVGTGPDNDVADLLCISPRTGMGRTTNPADLFGREPLFDDVAVVGVIVLWRRFEDDQLVAQHHLGRPGNRLVSGHNPVKRDDVSSTPNRRH